MKHVVMTQLPLYNNLIGEEVANFSAMVYLYYVVSARRGSSWDRLQYFIVALPWPSIQLF